MNSESTSRLKELTQKVKEKLAYTLNGIKRPAQGALKHDYLVPAGPYEEQWDWDAFFMAAALIAEDKTEAVYLKNWALNYIENATDEGQVAGCITPEGADPRLHQMKPLLAQGAYIAAKNLDDVTWLAPHWDKLVAICRYREEHLWNEEYNLGVWYDSMESGADNNPASLNFPEKSIISTDVNAFLYREYVALSHLSQLLGKESKDFANQAAEICTNLEKHCWSEKDQMLFNRNTVNGEFVECISYSSFVPLWAKMLPQEKGEAMLRNYLLSEDHMKSPYGIRTVSKQDKDYNNVNMIKPHSNWQGPIWPIANFFYLHALLHYGLKEEAAWLAERTAELVMSDIDKTGGMHENYDAETGEPLAAPNFISWNILVRIMIDNVLEGSNPLKL